MLKSIAAALLLVTTAAQADNKTSLLHVGPYWSVKHLSENSNRRPMCVMTAGWNIPGGVANLMLKVDAKGQLGFHLLKGGWTFAPGIDVPLTVTLDAGQLDLVGKTFQGAGQAPSILVLVPNAAAAKLIEDFGRSKSLTVTFKTGTEQPWAANMTGSQVAAGWFSYCVTTLTSPPASSPAPLVTSPVPPTASPPVAKSKPRFI